LKGKIDLQSYATNPDDLSTGLHFMHNQESNQPESGQGSGCGCWFLAVFALTPIFPVAAFMVLMLGLFFLCVAHRWAAVLLGLTLAVTCAIGAIVFLSDPNMGDMAPVGLIFLPWAGFGLWLAAGRWSKKRPRVYAD
jgi:uncharacterized membrane protein